MASVSKYTKPRGTKRRSLSSDPIKRAKSLANLREHRGPGYQSRVATADNVPAIKKFQDDPTYRNLVHVARMNTPEAVLVIVGMMRDMRCKPTVRFACAAWVAERGFGRAPQLIKVEDERPGLAQPNVVDSAAYAREVFRILKEAGANVGEEGAGVIEVSAMPVSGEKQS